MQYHPIINISLPENEPLGSNSSNTSPSLLLCWVIDWVEAGGDAEAGGEAAAGGAGAVGEAAVVVIWLGLAPVGEDALGAYAAEDSPSLLMILIQNHHKLKQLTGTR